MSRKSSKRARATLNRAAFPLQPQQQGGNLLTISPALLQQIINNMAPQKTQSNDFAPGSPLMPYKGITPKSGPRQYSFPVGYNLDFNDRTQGNQDIPTFTQLRTLARTYSGITVCERVWFDLVPRLTLDIGLNKKLSEAGAKPTDAKYAPRIAKWQQFFKKPDRVHDIHTWLRIALKEQTQIDALAIYKHPDRIGRLYALEILAGDTIKPLLDERGMRPSPPYPAYQQYPYGIPGTLLTSDQLIYYRESPSADTPYGFSRVERIIMEVNQALRKKKKDLARFTEGNLPEGFMEVPSDTQWTPDQIDSFEQAWNALMAGNTQQQVRMRFTAPGMKFNKIQSDDIQTPFDQFLLNITVASYGLSLADIGFIEDLHQSTGDSQQNMLYRRTLYPLTSIYGMMFTNIIAEEDGNDDLVVTFGGYEEVEDIATQASAYSTFANMGAISPASVARIMKFPEIPETGPLLITKSGITPLASFEIGSKTRQASDAAMLASYQQVTQPSSANSNATNDDDEDEESSSAQGSANKKATTASTATNSKQPLQGKNKNGLQRATDTEQHTGMMVAFMLDVDTASQLVIPDGESPQDMHVTLAYMGDKNDDTPEGKLHPVQHVDALKSVLQMFANSASPVSGKVGGLARFTPSPSSDGMSPVIALVNAPGLQAWRNQLVDMLETSGFFVANNFDYTPHITLSYIPEDAPMPIESVPALPLNFNTITLAVGDDRYTFPLQGQGKSQERAYEADEHENEHENYSQSIERHATDRDDLAQALADLRRWRDMALHRLKSGKPLRAFVSSCIPRETVERLERTLTYCDTPEKMRFAFTAEINRLQDAPLPLQGHGKDDGRFFVATRGGGV